ncbi:hypothetical protein DL98DRAFT_587842 [Cadophora sp. DSE1049]|nr:hypothetical protein DL98DRAFT_587842 [Cadophora sp. DSE1049]
MSTKYTANTNISFLAELPFDQKLDSFKLFPELPAELQVLIWQIAAADLPVRTCTIRRAPGSIPPNVASPNYVIGFQERWTTRSNPSRCPPVLLSICHDSRKLCKERYKLAFGGIDNHPVWFDFKKDVLDVQWKFLIELEIGSSAFKHVIADETSVRADCAQVKWLDEHLLALRYSECPNFAARRFRPFPSLNKITEISLKGLHNFAYSPKRARYLEIHLTAWKDLMKEWHATHKKGVKKNGYRSCPVLTFDESSERDDFDR